MNEQELRAENERLRRELAGIREDRDQLHKMVCGMLPLDEMDLTEDELKEMREKNVTILDLLHDPRFADEPPTNGTRSVEMIATKQA
jgi:hypothetical protein